MGKAPSIKVRPASRPREVLEVSLATASKLGMTEMVQQINALLEQMEPGESS